MARARDARTQDTAGHSAVRHHNAIRWAAVFGGTVLGIATLVVLTALVAAISIGGGVDLGGAISWWLAAVAIISVLVGGFWAGWLSAARGVTSGVINGVTVFGLIVLAALVGGVPGALNAVPGLAEVGGQEGVLQFGQTAQTAAWATFWGLLIGFVAAGLGGAIGGAVSRPGTTADEQLPAASAGGIVPHTHDASEIRGTTPTGPAGGMTTDRHHDQSTERVVVEPDDAARRRGRGRRRR